MTIWFQKEFILKSRGQGFHLVTEEVLSQLPELKKIKTGLLHLFIKHTSASLTINENADPSVRSDMEKYFDKNVKNESYFDHNYEGPDDMPAHIKTSLLGNSLSIPIINGRLNLGTWQGIYLCEHRLHSTSRQVVATFFGSEE